MHVLAIASRKGGSGKTTSAVSLAAAFAAAGRRALVIDLDPQGSASAWLRAPTEGPGLFEVFTEGAALIDAVRATEAPGVSIVAASPRLAGVEKALADEVGPERIFADAVAALPRGAADVVVIDSPPTLGLLSVSALVAARWVVIPTEATPLALGGVGDLMKTIDAVRRRLNRSLEIAGVLVCRADHRRNLTAESIELLRRHHGAVVLRAVVRESVRVAEAPSHGQTLEQYDPHGDAADDYRAAAREIGGRIWKGKA